MSIHLEGKTIPEHLKEARKKGSHASSEIHGAEPPGYLFAATDSAKETALIMAVITLIMPESLHLFLLFLPGWCIWKFARSSFLGWQRLQRVHRLIEEERWEIEHHRATEKEELMELYRLKGFSGKMLEEVVEVLMADDNRLLQVMLEEELGLTLETYEHPLKQGVGAFLGTLFSGGILLLLLYFFGLWGLLSGTLLIVAISSAIFTKNERNKISAAVTWNIAFLILVAAITYFMPFR